MQPSEVTLHERPFGSGELPRELNRFSWGAFLLPFFWGVVYRSWPVLTAWLLTLVGPSLILVAFGAGGENVEFGLYSAAYITAQVFVAIVELWVGANAYRLLWKRDAVLMELVSIKPRFTLERFLRRQRTWSIAGWSTTLIGVVSLIMFVDLLTAEQRLEAFGVWERYDITEIGILVSVAWLVAKVVAAFWLDYSMRAEKPRADHHAEWPEDRRF